MLGALPCLNTTHSWLTPLWFAVLPVPNLPAHANATWRKVVPTCGLATEQQLMLALQRLWMLRHRWRTTSSRYTLDMTPLFVCCSQYTNKLPHPRLTPRLTPRLQHVLPGAAILRH